MTVAAILTVKRYGQMYRANPVPKVPCLRIILASKSRAEQYWLRPYSSFIASCVFVFLPIFPEISGVRFQDPVEATLAENRIRLVEIRSLAAQRRP